MKFLKSITTSLYRIIIRFYVFIGIVVIVPIVALVRLFSRRRDNESRLLWGFDPIINNKYWANAFKQQGYVSDAVVFGNYSINNKDDFCIVLNRNNVFSYIYTTLLNYDIFHLSFNGGLFSRYGFGFIEPCIFKLCGIKTVIIAYGSDIHLYNEINVPSFVHALQSFYPQTYSSHSKVRANIDRWQKHGDFIITSMCFSNGFYRNDILTPNILHIETERYEDIIQPPPETQRICIVHSPNHRIIKGTEYIIEAIEKLKDSFDIDFLLLENIKNDEVLDILQNRADILVEKLVGPAYALSAIEGMAAGLAVVGTVNNPDWTDLCKVFSRYSFLDECPIVPASPETIFSVLQKLCSDHELIYNLGSAGQSYVRKYHSYDASVDLFGKIHSKICHSNDDITLNNYYHPIIGEFHKGKTKITRPLAKISW